MKHCENHLCNWVEVTIILSGTVKTVSKYIRVFKYQIIVWIVVIRSMTYVAKSLIWHTGDERWKFLILVFSSAVLVDSRASGVNISGVSIRWRMSRRAKIASLSHMLSKVLHVKLFSILSQYITSLSFSPLVLILHERKTHPQWSK